MNLKRILSVLTAGVMAVPIMYASSVSAISSQITTETEDEEPLIYIPDFPKEILDEFDIDWTGLASNMHTDSTTFDSELTHNDFLYDGGYALYSEQSYGMNVCYVLRWHDCNSYKAYQSIDFPLSDYTEEHNLSLDMHMDIEIKKDGNFRSGPLLELNDGKDEFFIIEKYTAEAVFPNDKKIGSYTADGKEYDLYMGKEADNEEASVRYCSVNKEGLTSEIGPDEHTHEEYSLNISEHLANLKSFTKKDIKIEKYGVLCEGKEGVGFGYCGASLKYDFCPLPEEKLDVDENGEPVVYENNMIKNLDGYRYSLQTANSRWPVTQDEEGRYHFTDHENNSFIIPKGNGTLTATISDGIFGTVSSGKEFDGKTPLLDKDYRLDYEYVIKTKVSEEAADDEDVSLPAAVASVWTLEPYVRLEYQERSNISDIRGEYLGTVEVDDEIYEIHGSDIYEIDMKPLGNPSQYDLKKYLFIHMDSKEGKNSEKKKGSFPITKLAAAAKAYGIKTGNIARIDLSIHTEGEYTMDILKNDIYVGENSQLDSENNGKIYADVAKSPNGVDIDPYTFYAYSEGYMYGYENGCFSAGSDIECHSTFEAGIVKQRDGRRILDTNKDINAEYKIENNYKECYQVEYVLSGEHNGVYPIIHIIENSKDYPFERNVIKSISGMYRSPKESKPEFVKTYTAGGHSYDLYKDVVTFSGCFSSTTYYEYLSIRQDQEDGETLKGMIDFKEHMDQIDPSLLNRMNMGSIMLKVDTGSEIGTVKVLKNDISFETIDVPWTIVGDFNDDLRVDSLDVAAARRELLKQLSDEDYFSPVYKDINHDDTFDIADIVMLQSYVLGKIKSLPEIY